MALILLAATLIAAASAGAEAQQPERSRQQVTCGADGYCALFKLDAGLTAAAWLDDARMYLAGYDGSIHLLNVDSGEIRTVLRGLSIPQGLIVLDGRLYATDMGNVCDVLPKPGELLESCMRDVTGREIEFHRAAGARILSFRIDPDGGVSDQRIIEDRILSRHRDYGPHGLATDGEYVYGADNGERSWRQREELNAVVAGGFYGFPYFGTNEAPPEAGVTEPVAALSGGASTTAYTTERGIYANGLTNDGEYVYVSIGYPLSWDLRSGQGDYFMKSAGELPGRDDLMGTIARFRPADEEPHVEVYARGLRNVYGISIAPYGTIYGADNDGTKSDGDGGGYHKEELNAIVAGANYGYPSHGTNRAQPEHGVTEPLAVLPGDGSTVAYAARHGVYVAYTHHTGNAVVDWFDYETFTPKRFFRDPGATNITSILERDGLLYLIVLQSGKIHVVEQGGGPVLSRMPIPEWARKWTMDGAVIRETYRAATAGEPAARSTFDVYLEGSRLIYVKEPCQAADMSEAFFLHVFPSDTRELPAERQAAGFDNPEVLLVDHGVVLDETCVAVAELPNYAVARVRTGQLGDLWEVEFSATDYR